MTENITGRINDAIENIKTIQDLFVQKYGEESLADKEIQEVLEIAKTEHKELQQYREIGTIREVQRMKESSFSGFEMGIITIRLEELKRYKAIGTVEEFHDAVQKQRASKPVVGMHQYLCPTCFSRRFIKQKHDYCQDCGQKLDWGESERADDTYAEQSDSHGEVPVREP